MPCTSFLTTISGLESLLRTRDIRLLRSDSVRVSAMMRLGREGRLGVECVHVVRKVLTTPRRQSKTATTVHAPTCTAPMVSPVRPMDHCVQRRSGVLQAGPSRPAEWRLSVCPIPPCERSIHHPIPPYGERRDRPHENPRTNPCPWCH